MSDLPARSGPSSSARWALIYVLLVPAVVLPLWVALYDRDDPTFLGFPFYYWFQFALILLAVTLTTSPESRPVPVAIAFFNGTSEYDQPIGAISAASVLITIPLVILVLICQKRIVAGMTAGAVKG